MNIQTINQLEENIKRITLNELLDGKGHYYKFLGACKIACIYLLEIDKQKKRGEGKNAMKIKSKCKKDGK